MLPRIKVFHLAFAAVFTTEFEDFLLGEQIYQLPIHRGRSIKRALWFMLLVFVVKAKVTKWAENRCWYSALILFPKKKF